VERIKRLSYPYSVEELRNEYAEHLKKETEILGEHNKQLSLEEAHQEVNEAQK
jgi:hypothetical protein